MFISSCDPAIHNKKYTYLVFKPISDTGLPKTLRISCKESVQSVFGYVNEGTLGKHLRRVAGCQGTRTMSEGWNIPFHLDFLAKEGGWRLNHQGPKISSRGAMSQRLHQVQRVSWFKNMWKTGRVLCPESMGASCPLSTPCPVCLFRLVVSELLPFYHQVVNQ